jgi:DNA-binding response OmpR family regulator
VSLPLAGFEVLEADSGQQALDLARSERLDIALLDVMMPGMGGFELAQELRADERTTGLPIVFLSARADQADMRRGFDVGAADYITKPFDPLQLGDHLNAVLHAVASGDTARLREARLEELR